MPDILHSCLRFPPALGGVETYCHDIVTMVPLAQRVVTSDLADHLSGERLSPEAVATRDGFVDTLPTTGRFGRGYPWMPGLRGKLLEPVSVIHGHAMYYSTFDLPLLVRSNASLVLSPYTNVRQTKKGRIYRGAIERLLGRADRIIFLTQLEADLFASVFPRAKRVPSELIPPVIRYAATPEDDSYDEDMVVIVGRLDEGKGTQDIPQFCRTLVTRRPRTRIRVFGAKSRLSHWLQAQARDPSLHLDVVVNADNTTLEQAVRHAAVFATPTRYEAFGIAAVEAAAAGVPVVGYANAGALPTVLDRSSDFTTARLADPDDLAHRVLEVLARNETSDERGERRQHYARVYGEPRWTQQWLALYGPLM